MTANHQFKNRFRKDYYSADYRRVYNGLLDQITAAEERAEDLKRQWATALRLRNEACYHPAGTQPVRYRYHRGRMAELEVEITRTKWDAERWQEIWDAMGPPRQRKTVLVDGIRTKLEAA